MFAPAPHLPSPSRLTLAVLLTAAGLITASMPAWAIDGATLVGRYQQLAEKRGASIEYEDLQETGDGSFTLRNLSLTGPQMKDPVRVHEVTISGAKDAGEDGFSAEHVTISGVSLATVDENGKDVTVTVDTGEASGIYIPDPADADAPLFEYPRSSMQIGNVQVSVDGKTAFTLDSIFGEAALDNDSKTHRTTAQIGSIVFHPENINDPEFRARLEKLGIDAVEMSANFAATWDLASGRVEMTEYSFDAPDYGKFSISLTLDGYTEEMATKLRQISADRSAIESGDTEAATAVTRKLMDTVSQLQLVSGRISFEDSSLTGKVLDYQAGEMGGSRDDIIDLASTMATGMTQALENPGFSAMLGRAVRTFLSEPHNLAISLEPETPVAVTDIFGAAIMSPNSLIEKLGLKVLANE